MTKNEAFLHLGDALPADIARRRDMGDLEGAVRLESPTEGDAGDLAA